MYIVFVAKRGHDEQNGRKATNACGRKGEAERKNVLGGESAVCMRTMREGGDDKCLW